MTYVKRVLGVDIAILGVDIAILGVDITAPGVDIVILGVDVAILMKQEKGGGGLQGKRGLAISHVSCLNSGWSAREFGDTRSHKERTSPPRPTPGMGQGGAM